MKFKAATIYILVFAFFATACATRDTQEIQKNREQILSFIEVGDQLEEAQKKLREKGFTLVYEEPIDPTKLGNYLQQLVVIGDTDHSAADTFFYVTTGGNGPIEKESPYLIIEAQYDGTITKIK